METEPDKRRHVDSMLMRESLLDKGFRELDIISQDVMSYGRDLKDGPSLASSLRHWLVASRTKRCS